MPTPTEPPLLLFTAPERDLIRRSLCMQFSQYPSVTEGILLRTWRGGPCAGQPKVPPPIRTMMERGLIELRTDGRWPRAHFTEAGWAALRRLAQDPRRLDPVQFADSGDPDQPFRPIVITCHGDRNHAVHHARGAHGGRLWMAAGRCH